MTTSPGASGNGKGPPARSEEESRHALLVRLIKILGMTTSDNDNTALVALRRANECLAKLDTTWHELLMGKVTIIADPFTVAPPEPKATPPRGAPPRQAAPTPQTPPRPQPAPPPPFTATVRGAGSGGGVGGTSRPSWQRTAPPRFKDKAQIKACLDKVMANPIKHQGTAYRIKQIEREFQVRGDLEQADWSFLAGTAASLRGVRVTADML